MRQWVLEIETVKGYQLIAKTWLRYWLENHKHVGWIWNYDNKVPNNSTDKENGRKMFVSFNISIWKNVSYSTHPDTISKISQFTFSPLFNGGNKIDAMKKMLWYPKEQQLRM